MSEEQNSSSIEIGPPELPDRSSSNRPWELKAAEIEAKKRELDRREEELRQREEHQQQQTTNGTRPASNWPPFYPLLHHDINAEIPAGPQQQLARQSYLLWRMTAAVYGLNLLAGILFLIIGREGVFGLIGDLFYFLVVPAAAFITWHLSLYNALRLNSGPWYAAYFISASLQIVLFGLATVGLIGGSAGGILSLLGAVSRASLLPAMAVGLCTVVMAFNLFGSVYLIQAVGRQYWARGQTGKDVTEAAMANPNIVQYALKNMA